MLDALLNVLNGLTDIPFVEQAWSSAPKRYGVISLSNQKALNTGEKVIAEKMLTGYVDVFEKKPQSLDTMNSVEDALRFLGIWFELESIQFEDDTGFTHYEWRWLDTLGIVTQKLWVVRFKSHDGWVGDPQLVLDGEKPVIPTDTISDYVEDGITYKPQGQTSWTNYPTSAVHENKVYEKRYYTEIWVRGGGNDPLAYNVDVPFTTEQIDILVEYFKHNLIVVLTNNGGTYNTAQAVTTEYVMWVMYPGAPKARWAT